MSNSERGQYKSGGMNFAELHEMGTRYFDRDGSGSLMSVALMSVLMDAVDVEELLFFRALWLLAGEGVE